jgi:hypothetical protein
MFTNPPPLPSPLVLNAVLIVQKGLPHTAEGLNRGSEAAEGALRTDAKPRCWSCKRASRLAQQRSAAGSLAPLNCSIGRFALGARGLAGSLRCSALSASVGGTVRAWCGRLVVVAPLAPILVGARRGRVPSHHTKTTTNTIGLNIKWFLVRRGNVGHVPSIRQRRRSARP